MKLTYSYIQILARNKSDLCSKINKHIEKGARVFQIDWVCSHTKGAWYGVMFEKQPPMKLAKLRAMQIKPARAVRA